MRNLKHAQINGNPTTEKGQSLVVNSAPTGHSVRRFHVLSYLRNPCTGGSRHICIRSSSDILSKIPA